MVYKAENLIDIYICFLSLLLARLSFQPTKHLAPSRPVREAYMALPIPFALPLSPAYRLLFGFLPSALCATYGRFPPRTLSGLKAYRIRQQASVAKANLAEEATRVAKISPGDSFAAQWGNYARIVRDRRRR